MEPRARAVCLYVCLEAKVILTQHKTAAHPCGCFIINSTESIKSPVSWWAPKINDPDLEYRQS